MVTHPVLFQLYEISRKQQFVNSNSCIWTLLETITVDTFSNSLPFFVVIVVLVATYSCSRYKYSKVFPLNFIACLLFSGFVFFPFRFTFSGWHDGGELYFSTIAWNRRILPFHFVYTLSLKFWTIDMANP